MPRGVYERTPEHCKAISDALTGVPRTPEACAAISAGKLGVLHTSDAQLAADKAHSERLRDVPLPPETCVAMSKAALGHVKSPEHCAALSKSMSESEAFKSAADAMRGGNDIVGHHIIYDHSDLSNNVIRMTRSMHMRVHRMLQRLGIEVSHINIMEE